MLMKLKIFRMVLYIIKEREKGQQKKINPFKNRFQVTFNSNSNNITIYELKHERERHAHFKSWNIAISWKRCIMPHNKC